MNVAQDTNLIISNDGNLIISQARLSDVGNYSCGAQNVVGRRLSDPALLSVYGIYSFFHAVKVMLASIGRTSGSLGRTKMPGERGRGGAVLGSPKKQKTFD